MLRTTTTNQRLTSRARDFHKKYAIEVEFDTEAHRRKRFPALRREVTTLNFKQLRLFHSQTEISHFGVVRNVCNVVGVDWSSM